MASPMITSNPATIFQYSKGSFKTRNELINPIIGTKRVKGATVPSG